MNLPGIRVEAIPLERIIKRPQSRRRTMNHQPAPRRLSPYDRHCRAQNQTHENGSKKKNRRIAPHNPKRLEGIVEPVTLKLAPELESSVHFLVIGAILRQADYAKKSSKSPSS